jgi:hypothetical protein
MVVALISHPCLFAVLRLMRDCVAPVSASTCSLNVGFPTGFRVQEQRWRRSAEVIAVAEGLRDRVAAFEKLPLPEVFLDLHALLRLLLLLLLMPLLLVLLLPLVLSKCLEFGEICCCSRFWCC